jgi:hypothetical protein
VQSAAKILDVAAIAAGQVARGGAVWVGAGALKAWLRRDRGIFFETAAATWVPMGLPLVPHISWAEKGRASKATPR